MPRKLIFLLLLFSLAACQQGKKPQDSEDLSSLDTPPSYLSFSVNFPVRELEEGVNRVLPMVLLDDVLPMKGKDTLYLKVRRKGNVNMAIRKNRVIASVPLEVSAAVKKKMLGITISNIDAPVEFSGQLKASATIDLNDNWGMDITCQYEGFDLGKSAEFSIMGMTFRIDGTINKALENHEDQLSDVICNALHGALDFRKIVEKVWLDLQKPQRISRKPVKLWLYSEPTGLNGQLMPKDRDTLSVHVEYRTVLEISPDYQPTKKKVPLPKKGKPLHTKANLLAYPKLVLPYEMLSQSIKQELINQRFTYEGYEIQIRDVNVSHEGQKLKVDVETSGDINGTVSALGVPAINDQRELVLEDFSYQIDASDDWVKMADWAVHQFAEDYVEDQVKLDTKPFFSGLDELIMDGLAKSKLGDKLAVRIQFDKVTSYQIKLTDRALEWVFYLEGESGITLKKGLFNSDNN